MNIIATVKSKTALTPNEIVKDLEDRGFKLGYVPPKGCWQKNSAEIRTDSPYVRPYGEFSIFRV